MLILRELPRVGADVNHQNIEGDSPLHRAVKEVLQIFVKMTFQIAEKVVLFCTADFFFSTDDF